MKKQWHQVLGNDDIPENISELARERFSHKFNKNYIEADRIRDKIQELGYIIVDFKDGYNIMKV